MERRGIFTLPLQQALDALEYSIVNQLAQVVVAPVKWNTASNSLPALSSSLFSLSLLAQADANSQSSSESGNSQKGGSVSARAAALATEGEERVKVVRESIKEKIGAMLGVNGEDVESSRKIADLGVDSLMAIEVKNWVDKEFQVQVSVLDITGGKTVEDLAAKISSSLSSASTAASTSSVVAKGPYVCIKQVAQPSRRIVCYPFLGGDYSAFSSWKDLVPQDVEVWAYAPTVISEWKELLDHLTTQIPFFEQSKSVPVTLYGHSLGALIAFEVACKLQAEGKPIAGVMVGASGSPNQPAAFSKISEQWDDAALLALSPEALTNGLLQAQIVENTLLSPEILRSELFLGRRYAAWAGATKKFTGPIHALIGTNDIVLPNPNIAEAWKEFGASFQLSIMQGGSHLFILDRANDVTGLLFAKL